MHAIFAERVVVDRFTNDLTVSSIVETLVAHEPPPEVMAQAKREKKGIPGSGRLMLLVHWRRSDPKRPEGRYRSRIELVGPNKKVIATATQDFDLREHLYMRNVLRLGQMSIVGEGTYTARIAVKQGGRWKPMGETSLQLVFSKQATDGGKVRIH